jgi:hypothetical protein
MSKGNPKSELMRKTIWSNPHPHSAMMLAAQALERAHNLPLAFAVRQLAKAEANRGIGTADSGLDTKGVIDKLQEAIADMEWLIEVIKLNKFDSQHEIPQLLPEHHRKRCNNPRCQRWFVIERSTGMYCSSACKQSAYRKRVRNKRYTKEELPVNKRKVS